MQDLHKNLIIIENQSSFSVNGLFDDAVIEGRIVEKDYKFLFQLLFSNDGTKLIAFKRVALVGSNPRRQRIMASSNGKILEELDFFDDFKSFINELDGDKFDFIVGGNESNFNKVKELTKNATLIDPYSLIDREYFYSKNK